MRRFLQLTLDLFADVVVPALQTKEPASAAIQNATPAPNAEKDPAQAVGFRGESLALLVHPSRFVHPRANREARLRSPSGKRADQGGGECVVAYELRRGQRKTIGFVVSGDGLVVSAPRWVPLYEIDKALHDKSSWILSKLVQAQERQQRLADMQVQWQEGAVIPFMGENVIIVLDPRQEDGSIRATHPMAQLHTDAHTLPGITRLTLHVGLPHQASAERIRDAVQAWLMRQAKRVFEERLNHFAPRLGVKWTKLSLSNATGRWGSAGADGAIRLNWRLIHFRLSVIDYVVVHELSHLRVMDHSPRFWSTVESIMPNYTEQKSQLRDELIPRW